MWQFDCAMDGYAQSLRYPYFSHFRNTYPARTSLCGTLHLSTPSCQRMMGNKWMAKVVGNRVNVANLQNASNINAGTLATARGGTGTGSALIGLMRGGNPMSAAEMSGDCTTSGSNAITCTQTNGSNWTVSTSGAPTTVDGLSTASSTPGVAPIIYANHGTFTTTSSPGSLGTLTLVSSGNVTTGWYDIDINFEQSVLGASCAASASDIMQTQLSYQSNDGNITVTTVNLGLQQLSNGGSTGLVTTETMAPTLGRD
jgi:hypothetical protein